MTEDVLEDFEQNYQNRKDWIVGFGDITAKAPFGVQCLRCGQIENFLHGISVIDYCQRTAAFALAHKECPAREDYPDIP